ncbi:MAG: hypothetical protein EZS28_038871 [Streblomastix strix]|uniref:Uncharacterized protein n=1 Tax=Streblomastix strix TaxID=222440 RepID=A0A5J4U6L8_9EUKA|nr:MAG: hypothetical protein EZS28_038871 [Streblomastix strix]
MQIDLPENHSDKDSTWTEDEAPQHQVTTSQLKQPAQPIQRIQQIQVQPKQYTTVQNPRQRDRRNIAPNQDYINEQEILQEKLAALQGEKEQNGTIEQLTGLQLSSGAQSPSLNARLRLKEAGSISANNREKIDPQMNEGHENAEEEEEEQTDETALNQNEDYRVNINSYSIVQENLGIQSQNYQVLNTMSQMDKDNIGPAQVGVHEKPKKGKESKKIKPTEGLIVSNEPSQGSNDQIQIQTASTFPKTKATPKKKARKKQNRLNSNQKPLIKKIKRSISADLKGTLQPREISVEISLWNREQERADYDNS